MKQMLDTLAQLQRLRDSTVQTTTVALARQRQVAIQYENNLRALRQLMPKTRAEAQPHFCPQTLSNMAGYKGNLLRVMKWQEQEQALAEIKMQQLQKGLLQAACQEKIVALTLDGQRERAASEQASREQKEVDEIASQSWLRTQRLTEQER
ncbi:MULTISPECIES: flagellar export protein FliJ [Enterobacteriaceae]|uniref:flagellar export protein FliJ n=1 Tax=Enterobacteriaceae TaxID=543 RepID=UPI0011A02727|nr:MULTISPECIES: flagellar export protein FliJ [Enterobacteriaceae]WPO94395.1 flagellar export protein FliJ [Buttiauxella sp. HR94]